MMVIQVITWPYTVKVRRDPRGEVLGEIHGSNPIKDIIDFE